jgi:hypothetical protein
LSAAQRYRIRKRAGSQANLDTFAK